jgi:TPR repeat protein
MTDQINPDREALEKALAAFNDSLSSLPPEKIRILAEQDTHGKSRDRAQATLHFQFVYGMMLYEGDRLPQNHQEAVRWWNKAAGQGNAKAQHALAVCYGLGQGVARDLTMSAEMYRRAAENGHALAQNDLGNCYFTGEGVPRDMEQASAWWMKAELQDIPQAQFNVGCVAFNLEKNPVKACIWWRLAKGREPGAAEQLRKVEPSLTIYQRQQIDIGYNAMLNSMNR